MAHTIELNLDSPKKSCGKYVVVGTEKDPYPSYVYIKREWIPDPRNLPFVLKLTIEAQPE